MSGRCLSCNRVLNDFEMTRKFAESSSYVGLCNKCYKASDMNDIPVVEREDLRQYEDVDSDDEFEEVEDEWTT